MGGYVIWHKPTCSSSRYVLAALRDAGVGVTVRDYVADPPSETELRAAVAALGIWPRGLLRRRGTPYQALRLDDPSLGDDALIAAMAAHPLLIERPAVFGPRGAVLCRPRDLIHGFLALGAM